MRKYPPILLITLLSKTLTLCSFQNVSDQVLHPYKTTDKIILGSTEGLVWFRGLCGCFVTWLNSYGEELLAPRPTLKVEDHPLSVVGGWLLNIFAATLQIWGPFLQPQPEDEPCRGNWLCLNISFIENSITVVYGELS
jgi:hypothetical protein